MCLHKLRKFKVPIYGYKIFEIEDYTGDLFKLFQGLGKKYPINKILHEKLFRTEYYKGEELLFGGYPYGFHMFKSLKAAKKKYTIITTEYISKFSNTKYGIYKVEIIEPHTTGIEMLNDTYCHVIVSKKMRIIEKI